MQAAHNLASQAQGKVNIAQQLAMAARHPQTTEEAAVSVKLIAEPPRNVEGRRCLMLISLLSHFLEVAAPLMLDIWVTYEVRSVDRFLATTL